MATLAHKSPNPSIAAMGAPTNGGRDYASTVTSARTLMSSTVHSNSFASPTESEFSEVFEGPDSVRSWDEKRVADWLKSINCGQYTDAFKGEPSSTFVAASANHEQPIT